MRNVPHGCLNLVPCLSCCLGGHGIFRGWSLAGGSTLLGLGSESLLPRFTFDPALPTPVMHCQNGVGHGIAQLLPLFVCCYASPAIMAPPSGPISQNKLLLLKADIDHGGLSQQWIKRLYRESHSKLIVVSDDNPGHKGTA